MKHYPTADKELDTIGLRCPDPLLHIRQALRKMASQQVLLILADDPTMHHDIPHFCHFLSHTLLAAQTIKTPYQFWIKKGEKVEI